MTDFQPLDQELTALAGLPSAADKVPFFTGTGTAALAPFTAAGRGLVGAADAAAQRTAMGLGSAATMSTGTATGTVATGNHTHTASAVGAAPSSHVGSGGNAHSVATTSAHGFMSKTDKAKLDGIAAGATNLALSSTAAVALGPTGLAGAATTAARADHAHPFPTSCRRHAFA